MRILIALVNPDVQPARTPSSRHSSGLLTWRQSCTGAPWQTASCVRGVVPQTSWVASRCVLCHVWHRCRGHCAVHGWKAVIAVVAFIVIHVVVTCAASRQVSLATARNEHKLFAWRPRFRTCWSHWSRCCLAEIQSPLALACLADIGGQPRRGLPTQRQPDFSQVFATFVLLFQHPSTGKTDGKRTTASL